MASESMMQAFEAEQLQAFGRRIGDIDLAVARQRDGAAFDHRALNFFGLGTLFLSDDAERATAANMASRIPSTLSQPGAGTGVASSG